MPQNRQKGDKEVRVVAERREVLDRDLLSVALFGWVMDKVRADKHERAVPPQSSGHRHLDEAGDVS